MITLLFIILWVTGGYKDDCYGCSISEFSTISLFFLGLRFSTPTLNNPKITATMTPINATTTVIIVQISEVGVFRVVPGLLFTIVAGLLSPCVSAIFVLIVK